MTGPAVAAVDCGTNSTRLLVTDGEGRALERRSTITRLGDGVERTGRLDEAAVERVIECLRSYREVMDGLGVDGVRMTATSAVRDAVNRDQFLEAAARVVGVGAEVISGDEEARFAYVGATAELDVDACRYLVVDIGGGSTEFATGSDSGVAALSVDVGCVRLSERYLAHDPPRPEELLSCLDVVETHLDDVARLLPGLDGTERLVGVAGTVSTAAAVDQGLATYDRDRIHHFVLTKPAVESLFRDLATETAAERRANPGLEPGRVDTIVAGLCVLVKVMRYWSFDECLVSEADLLDGLIMSQLAPDRAPGSEGSG